MPSKELKKEWKFVCDSFRAYCRKKLPSGSETSPRSFVYYESMQFLLDLQLQSFLATDDIGEAANDENSELDTNSSTDRCASNLSGNSSTASKRRRFDNDSELQDLIGGSFDEITHFRSASSRKRGSNEILHRNGTRARRFCYALQRLMKDDLQGIEDEDARNEIIRRLFEILFDAKRELANKRKHK